MILKKKIVCVALICMLLVPQLGAIAQAAAPQNSDDIAALKLDYLREHVYPDGWYWAGGDLDSATSYPSGGSGNVFNRSTECQAFALKLATLIWGSCPTYLLGEYRDGLTDGNWTCYTRDARGTQGLYDLGLKPGDIIRAGYGSYSNGHTAVVWKVDGDSVWFVEAWGSQSCKINWGGFNYYSYSLADICARYSVVAIWRYDDSKSALSGEDRADGGLSIQSRSIAMESVVTTLGAGGDTRVRMEK